MSQPRSGAPRKLSEEQRDHLYDVAISKPNLTHQDLPAEVDHACKERSSRYLLREMNLRKWRKLKRPQLKPEHAAARLLWAQKYQHIDWSRVKWSDECMVKRGHGQRTQWTFLWPGEQLEARDVVEVRRQGAVKQMFWAASGPATRTGLISINGHADGQLIYDLYASFLPVLSNPAISLCMITRLCIQPGS